MRDLIARIPKRRGFRNKPKGNKSFMLRANILARLDGEVTIARLKKERLVPLRHAGSVKVVGLGEFKKPMALKGVSVSKGVKVLIEKAGGTIEQ